jgi:hypothetical protein
MMPIRFKHGGDPDSRFDPHQLRIGTKVEMEHTYSRRIAKMISKAHLAENKKYYSKLRKAGL